MSFDDVPTAVRITATGNISATPCYLVGVSLTPAAALSNLVIRNGGAGGTILLSLQAAAAGQTNLWLSGNYPIRFGTDCHATLSGVAAEATATIVPIT